MSKFPSWKKIKRSGKRKGKSDYDIINEYYEKRRISESVRGIKVNQDMLNTALQNPNYMEQREAVYSKFEIKSYANEYEFRLAKRSIYPNIPDDKLAEMWKDYLHRDKLIISGQYEQYRYESYREKYLDALKRMAMPSYVIKSIERIPLENWKDIIILPSPNKNEESDKQFPKLGGFTYGEASRQQVARITSEITDAFRALKIEMVNPEAIQSLTKDIISRHESVEDSIETAYVLDNLTSVVPALKNKSSLKYDTIEEEIVSLGMDLPTLTKKGTPMVKTSKTGHRYIPFVGSTNPNTKNKKIMDLLLDGYDNK